MRGTVRAALLGLALALTAACGLPVEEGVQTPPAVSANGQLLGGDQQGTTVILPPGPRAGATPVGVVSGFLQAQASPDGDHEIARRFLAPDLRRTWDDGAQVRIYDPQQLSFEVIGDQESDLVQVRLRGLITATVAADGTLDPTDGELDETYALRRDAAGDWVLTDVPTGLRLRQKDVDRSYATEAIYFVAKDTGTRSHVVPDLALLPVEKEPAEALVRRLVSGPSSRLAGAVSTAVPADAEVVDVSVDSSGVVTVDLGPTVPLLPPGQRARLSAQLVWTLREASTSFSGLRLVSAGQPVEVPGVDEVQERGAWDDQDPDGLREQVTTFYIAERRLRTLEAQAPVAAAADLVVDRAAISPRGDELALLTDVGEGRWEVRIGPLNGPLPSSPGYVGGGLRSPSWGAGYRGLWLLQTGPGPQVVLLDRLGTVTPVPIVDPPPGRLTALRVSRDGARIAFVAGEDDASRRVYVAPVVDGAEGLRIGPPQEIGFGVTNVTDVAWESATSVVALGEFSNLAPLPLKLAIDGSGGVDLVRLPGLEQVAPESLAAGPGRPLVVAVKDRDGRSVLFRSTGQVFEQAPVSGYAPFYPG